MAAVAEYQITGGGGRAFILAAAEYSYISCSFPREVHLELIVLRTEHSGKAELIDGVGGGG